MRKFALLAVVFVFLSFAHFASAQQGDAMIGFGTIMSPSSTSCSSSFGNYVCPETGGLYPSISADVIFHRRLGFAYEVTWRAGQGAYPATGQPYRPIINTFNADYQPRLGKKFGLDLLGGVGFQDTRFYGYVPTSGCVYFGACFSSTMNFVVDAGAGVRYYFWHHVFIRPEVRYYYIDNNTNNFSSDHVFRVGASIGYTIGPD